MDLMSGIVVGSSKQIFNQHDSEDKIVEHQVIFWVNVVGSKIMPL